MVWKPPSSQHSVDDDGEEMNFRGVAGEMRPYFLAAAGFEVARTFLWPLEQVCILRIRAGGIR